MERNIACVTTKRRTRPLHTSSPVAVTMSLSVPTGQGNGEVKHSIVFGPGARVGERQGYKGSTLIAVLIM